MRDPRVHTPEHARAHASTHAFALACSASELRQVQTLDALTGMERQVGDIILKVDGDDVYGKKLAELAEGNWCKNARAPACDASASPAAPASIKLETRRS